MLKKSLVVLSAMILIGMSAIVTISAARTFYDLALLQVEQDLMLAYSRP